MNVNGNFSSIEQVAQTYLSNPKAVSVRENGKTFEEVFKEKSEGLRFSKHAGERLAMRNINLTDSQIQRLEEGTQKASKKGIKESLMIMDNMAFIVNVTNSTVITAMDQSEQKENIFTNIDGAVII
ncbi:MAG: flagellar protein [Lachnospiraceae bacterium]|nr:flagellar protein [Lachnospiraceae bacterium]